MLQIRVGPERTTKTREYDLLRITVGRQEPPRPRSTIPVALHVVLQGTPRNVKGVAVPVVPRVVLHVVLQGALRNMKGVAVPVVLHAVLQPVVLHVVPVYYGEHYET